MRSVGNCVLRENPLSFPCKACLELKNHVQKFCLPVTAAIKPNIIHNQHKGIRDKKSLKLPKLNLSTNVRAEGPLNATTLMDDTYDDGYPCWFFVFCAFQSYSQNHVGWKIHVVKPGYKWDEDKKGAAGPPVSANLPLTCAILFVTAAVEWISTAIGLLWCIIRR